MGNNETKGPSPATGSQLYRSADQLEFKLNYIETFQDNDWGQVQILRFKEAPYEYIMKQSGKYSLSDPRYSSARDLLKFVYEEFTHKNIAKLHYYRTQEKLNMCGRTAEIDTYSSYYAINLKQLIEQHRKNDSGFRVEELWYIIKSLCQVSVFLQRVGYLVFQGFKSDKITISAEGYVRLYIYQLHQDVELHWGGLDKPKGMRVSYRNHLYEQAAKSRDSIWEFLPLPPEFLPALKNGSHFMPTDQYSCHLLAKGEGCISKQMIESWMKSRQDSFFIGMILMEMLTDQDLRRYFHHNIDSREFCRFEAEWIQKDIARLQQIYPSNLIHIISRLVDQNISQRMPPTSVLEYIQLNEDQLSIGASLRMFNTKDDLNKIPYQMSIDYSSSPLRALESNLLESKLAVTPIQTLTKRQFGSKGSSLASVKISRQPRSIEQNTHWENQHIDMNGNNTNLIYSEMLHGKEHFLKLVSQPHRDSHCQAKKGSFAINMIADNGRNDSTYKKSVRAVSGMSLTSSKIPFTQNEKSAERRLRSSRLKITRRGSSSNAKLTTAD